MDLFLTATQRDTILGDYALFASTYSIYSTLSKRYLKSIDLKPMISGLLRFHQSERLNLNLASTVDAADLAFSFVIDNCNYLSERSLEESRFAIAHLNLSIAIIEEATGWDVIGRCLFADVLQF